MQIKTSVKVIDFRNLNDDANDVIFLKIDYQNIFKHNNENIFKSTFIC